MGAVQIRIGYANGRTEERLLADGTYRIGRDAGDIVLNDANVSSSHAELEVHGGQVSVTDLGSTNGTLDANGQRLSGRYTLKANETVRIGSSSITSAGGGGTVVMAARPTPAPVQTPAPAPAPGFTPAYGAGPSAGYAGSPPPAAAPPVGSAVPYVQPSPGPTAYSPPQPPGAQYGQAPGQGSPYGQPYPATPYTQPNPGTPPYAQPYPGSPSPYGQPPQQGFGVAPYPGSGLQQPFGPGASTNQNYALWPERALGYILDLVGVPTFLVAIIYSVVVGVMTHAAMGAPGGAAMVGASTGMSCLLTLLFPLVAVGISFWNRGYLVGKRGYSIGQGLVHVKVVDAEGRPVTMGVAMLRVLAHIGLSFVPLAGLIDLLWPLWDPQVQTLHDKVVKCFVVKDSARR